MNLHLLRDFAEAYADFTRAKLPEEEERSAIKLALAAISLGVETVELKAFNKAISMLYHEGKLADEDIPMVERLRLQSALRFARKLALLPPTVSTEVK